MTRIVSYPRTPPAYLERRTKEGRSKREVIRVLKRYVAREVFKHLPLAEISERRVWLQRSLPSSDWPSSDLPARPSELARRALMHGLIRAYPRPASGS